MNPLHQIILAGAIIVLLFSQSIAQEQSQIIEPILVSKETLSGIGLKQIQLKDQPERDFFQKNLFRGKELSLYVVSSESWTAKMDNFSIDEYIYILNGKARVKPDGGDDQYVQVGEHCFAPKGFTGEWEILAGDHYHYELSVISTQRADSVSLSRNMIPHLLDKDQLSGVHIDFGENGLYEQVLVRGDELTLAIKAEKPRIQEVQHDKEYIISLLSGQLTLYTHGKDKQVFYSGDVIILPKGYTGTWESNGHGLIKYLVIEATVDV